MIREVQSLHVCAYVSTYVSKLSVTHHHPRRRRQVFIVLSINSHHLLSFSREHERATYTIIYIYIYASIGPWTHGKYVGTLR